MNSSPKSAELQQFVYNRRTGRILGTYFHHDAASATNQESSPDDVLELFRGSASEEELADGLDVITVTEPPPRAPVTYRVDLDTQQLIPKLTVRVETERTRLDGDGRDSVELRIAVVDESGETAQDFTGDLRVVTTRGKLSASGGWVKVASGTASVQLTSTAETVSKVRVTVSDPSGQCMVGSVDLEFL